MFTLTMSTEGQFTLPREVRQRLKLAAGTKVQGSVDEKGRIVLVPARHSIDELFKNRPRVTRVATVEQMNEGIASAVTEADDATRTAPRSAGAAARKEVL